jgi:hypothetical protein
MADEMGVLSGLSTPYSQTGHHHSATPEDECSAAAGVVGGRAKTHDDGMKAAGRILGVHPVAGQSQILSVGEWVAEGECDSGISQFVHLSF